MSKTLIIYLVFGLVLAAISLFLQVSKNNSNKKNVAIVTVKTLLIIAALACLVKAVLLIP